MAEENVVYIGAKPTMNYVLALITQFHNNIKSVTVKARGRSITKAVDVVEIARSKFIKDIKPTEIKIKTEEMKTESGTRNVSAIEIKLEKSA